MLKFCCDPIETVKVGFIGLGTRGIKAVERFQHIKGAKIAALCDRDKKNLSMASEILPEKESVIISTDWKKVCEVGDIDLIYISTDWLTHAEIAVYSMLQGKHVAVEVPAAFSVEECWQLVDTAEQTRKHCMMLENCCYDEFELNTLNMLRQGVFGEVVHGEGAYIHDLRSLNFPPTSTSKKGMRRADFAMKYAGNIYPTHGLGPICVAMNIHRGDKMNYLVSMSSKQWGISDYALKNYGENSEEYKRKYRLGDMNTTLIYTELGKTIMLQHDVNNPRPYSRIHAVTALNGYFCKYPAPQIAFSADGFLPDKEMEELLKKYEHPFITEYGKQAKKISGDRFFDFIMDSRLIYCLQNGLPLDMNVYDAAAWSCITELSEISVKNGSAPVEIPDFTRGKF